MRQERQSNESIKWISTKAENGSSRTWMNGSRRTWIHQQFILDDLANATMSSGLSALASTFQSGKHVQYTSEE